MAERKEVKSVELDVLERQYVRRAIETLRGVLTRSRAKEMAGSEVWAMRGRELEALQGLLDKV